VATRRWNKFDDTFTRLNRFDTVHERDRHQTDGQTPHDGRPRLCRDRAGKIAGVKHTDGICLSSRR